MRVIQLRIACVHHIHISHHRVQVRHQLGIVAASFGHILDGAASWSDSAGGAWDSGEQLKRHVEALETRVVTVVPIFAGSRTRASGDAFAMAALEAFESSSTLTVSVAFAYARFQVLGVVVVAP